MAFNPNKCLKFTCSEAPVTIIANNDSRPTIHYQFSKNGTNWSQDTISLQPGEFAYCKGTEYPGIYTEGNIYSVQFECSGEGKILLSGNVMSLVDDGAGALTEITQVCGFESLFFLNKHIISINSGLLPATTLSEECYGSMFSGCSNLLSLPENLLPATSLAPLCYEEMFADCVKLTSIPKSLLPATSLAPFCYSCMFCYCTSLTKIEKDFFKATSFAESCYMSLFEGCENLKEIEVPWTSWPQKDDSWEFDPLFCWAIDTYPTGSFYCSGALPQIFDESHIPENWKVIVPMPKVYFQPEKL